MIPPLHQQHYPGSSAEMNPAVMAGAPTSIPSSTLTRDSDRHSVRYFCAHVGPGEPEDNVRNLHWLLALLLGCQPAAAQAPESNAATLLTNELKAHVPHQWEVRVLWRDGQLLAFITPWPYQAAFDLWYDAPKLQETLTNLCPDPRQEIWKLLNLDQDVILEPTVGGKGGVEARVSCRRAKFSSQ